MKLRLIHVFALDGYRAGDFAVFQGLLPLPAKMILVRLPLSDACRIVWMIFLIAAVLSAFSTVHHATKNRKCKR